MLKPYLRNAQKKLNWDVVGADLNKIRRRDSVSDKPSATSLLRMVLENANDRFEIAVGSLVFVVPVFSNVALGS